MGFWIFGRKKEDNYKVLHEKLTESFSHIKKDMGHLGKWVEHFKGKHDKHESGFTDVNQQINLLKRELEVIKEFVLTPKKEVVDEISEEKELDMVQTLTDTQKYFFIRLKLLQKESKSDWIPMKTVAEDYYPSNNYQKIKSTLSEYFTLLTDLDLVKKKRKGRRIYLKVTKKGNKYFNKEKEKVIKKVKQTSRKKK